MTLAACYQSDDGVPQLHPYNDSMETYYAKDDVVVHAALHPYGTQDDTDNAAQSSTIYNLPTDSEGEAEVDELESDTDAEQGESASTSVQKKAGRRLGERVPGTTLLPIPRIENIVQADGITSSLSMSKEAAFMISIATEEFIKRMVQAGHIHASASRRNIVNYTDMASSTEQYQEFMFLQDTIPEPISLAEALERRKTKEKEDLETNPAMSSAIGSNSPGPTPSGHLNGKLKARSRPANGKEKAAAIAAQHEDRRQEEMYDSSGDPVSANVVRSSSGRVIRSTRAARQDEADDEGGFTNGFEHSRDHDSWAGSRSPRRPSVTHQSPRDAQNSTPQPFTPPWAGQFTGPASGFLPDSQNTFGRMAPTGRTIYSQDARSESASYR